MDLIFDAEKTIELHVIPEKKNKNKNKKRKHTKFICFNLFFLVTLFCF